MPTDWKKVWNRKGAENTEDLCLLNGHEKTNFRDAAVNVVGDICETMGVNKDSRILEVGCGAGMLAQHFDCNYVGVDYSDSLIEKHRNILGNNVFVAEAANLPFEDKSFDFVFSFSVFHYFRDKKYVHMAISEMERVSKKSIFIGDLPINSCTADHLLFQKEEFEGWQVSGAYYTRPDKALRFNAHRIIN